MSPPLQSVGAILKHSQGRRHAVAVPTVGTIAHGEVISLVLAINDYGAASNITIEALRDNSGLLSGSGGNVSVFSARDGKLLVDGRIAEGKAVGWPAVCFRAPSCRSATSPLGRKPSAKRAPGGAFFWNQNRQNRAKSARNGPLFGIRIGR
jgi:hypothetical protein